MKNIFKALSVCTILSGVVVNGSYGVDIKTGSDVVNGSLQQESDLRGLIAGSESEVSDSEEVVMKKMDEEEYSKRLDDIFEKLLEVEKNEKAREYMIKVLEMVETALYKKHEVYDVEQGEFVRMNEDEIDAFKINSAGELCRGCELCSEVELLTIENFVDNLVEKIKKEKGGEQKK